MCLLFNKRPLYENFLKLLTPEFLKNIEQYNVDNVSEYTISQLKNYVDDPKFTTEVKYSSTASTLCSWIVAVYNYSLYLIEVIY